MGETGEPTDVGVAGGLLRRTPRQARSRARVRRLLEAAERVLATEGFEALTVRRIAADAGVPVGTLYQFFPDKQAVVDALARRYLEEFEAVMTALVERAGRERWEDPVLTLLEAFIAAYRARPGYVALWTGRHLGPELQRADRENNAAIADGVRRVLAAQLDLPETAELARACGVAVQVCDALLQHAFGLDPAGDDEVLAELVRMQRLYLADLLARTAGG